MNRIDLKKEYKALYTAAAGKPALVSVAGLQYLACDGHGDPNARELFQEVVAALYSVAYTLKFMLKKGSELADYSVMPLEGEWWADDMNDFAKGNRSAWKWTLMILQPAFITPEMVAQAVEKVAEKKPTAMLPRVRLEARAACLAAHVLHVGPYSAEGPAIALLHSFIAAGGYQLTGVHREIYLNDMRRTVPEKLKTIIRQPVTK